MFRTKLTTKTAKSTKDFCIWTHYIQQQQWKYHTLFNCRSDIPSLFCQMLYGICLFHGSMEENNLVSVQTAVHVDLDGFGVYTWNHFHLSLCHGILYGSPDEQKALGIWIQSANLLIAFQGVMKLRLDFRCNMLNFEHPTSNIERRMWKALRFAFILKLEEYLIRCSTFDVRCWTFMFFIHDGVDS